MAEGGFDTLSAWVSETLRQRAELDEKLRGLDEWIAEYEAEHGKITDEEIAEVAERMKNRAIKVRRRREVA